MCSQGDTLKILDDLQALRPTVFVSVPRLYSRIHDKIIGGAKAKGGLAAALFGRALKTKLEVLHATGSVEHALWDKLVFSKVRKQLGLDRCAKMVCGSAPIAAGVKDFLRVAIGAVFVEGYGLTETTASASISHPNDVSNNHVGMPTLCCELKLEDVAEMGYTSANTPPAGEVLVRGPCVFSGYYKMEDKTAEAFDANGWFHTGDIGAWNDKGCLRIVDRKKNIFKLAQGECVASPPSLLPPHRHTRSGPVARRPGSRARARQPAPCPLRHQDFTGQPLTRARVQVRGCREDRGDVGLPLPSARAGLRLWGLAPVPPRRRCRA